MLGPIWITRDRRRVYPSQMADSHIRNTIRMIESGRMAREGRTQCSGFTNAEWLLILRAELVRRNRHA